MGKIFTTAFFFLAAFSALASDQIGFYKNLKVGDWVKYTIHSKIANMVTETVQTWRVTEASANGLTYTMETATKVAGKEFPAPIVPVKIDFSQLQGATGKIIPPHGGGEGVNAKTEESKEEVELKGKKIQCAVYTTSVSANGTTIKSRAFNSPEVPFGIVKSLTEGAGTTTEMKLVDFGFGSK